jgi:ankyrin repeat protein
MNLSCLIKNIRKNSVKEIPHGNEFSLLHQKKFFKRIKRRKIRERSSIKGEKIKEKDDEDLINYSSDITSSKISSESKDADDIYYELVRYIFESKNKNFIEFFERNKKAIDINQQLVEGNSLLILSSREGNPIITRYLCEQGLEINKQNNNGNTALHYAIANQFYSVADILTRFGAREDIANNKGLYPWDCIEHNLE